MSRNFGMTPYVGADLDDIIGAAVQSVMGASDEDEQLAAILSGDEDDDTMGYDDIVGAVKKIVAAKAKRSGGNVPPSAEKWELLPIPLTTLAAGETRTFNVTPTRSQRLDRIEFPSSNPDHAVVTLVGIDIAGTAQLNGSGGIRLSQLSEMRSDPILRGNTVQANAPISLTVTNTDTVNARTLFGSIGGPTVRQGR